MKVSVFFALLALSVSSAAAAELRGERELHATPVNSDSCKDESNWKDSYGLTCDWYKSNCGACQLYGNQFANAGHTANTACCICTKKVIHPGVVTYNTIVLDKNSQCATAENGFIVQKTCDASNDSQKWEHTSYGLLRNKATNKCAYSTGGAIAQKADLSLVTCPTVFTDKAYQFKFDNKLIKSVKNEAFCVDYSNSKLRWQWYTCNASNTNQLWTKKTV